MTYYASIDEIRRESGFENNDNVTNEDITKYQIIAQSLIDGFLIQIYALPLTETPAILNIIARLLAAGELLKKEYGPESTGTSKDGKAKCDEGMDLLKMVADKTIKLVDSSNNIMPESGNDDTEVDDYYEPNTLSGEAFNLSNENFRFSDPDKPFEVGIRDSEYDSPPRQ